MRAIGVDLGGTNLRVALVDLCGDEARVERVARGELASDTRPMAVIGLLLRLIGELGELEGELPVGIGFAGMLRMASGVVENAPNLGWREVPFVALASQALGRRVWLENDVAAITWGEVRFGAARGLRDVVGAFVGTGVGGGAVLDGRPFRGATGASLEIGHVKVFPGGRRCGCGARGCLEAYAGGRHVVERARESASAALLELVGGREEELHAGHVEQAARAGDAACAQVMEEAAQALGRGLADAVTLINPEGLVMGGTVWRGCPGLRKQVVEIIFEMANAPARGPLRVLEAQRESDAGMVGAADLALAARVA
ncbi:MAG: ROK family protein [Deltaproteobacteria bacterium]|nr:ROK family protein [Deltaproteobacteria bacterium]